MLLSLRIVALMALSGMLFGCAYLHRVQLAEVEPPSAGGRKLSVKVSETTIDFREAGQLAKDIGKFSNSRPLGEAGKIMEMYAMLFQYGPRTGAPVFNETYAREIPEALASRCRHGRIANVVSVREAREYPVVKGEIVRIEALCLGGAGGNK